MHRAALEGCGVGEVIPLRREGLLPFITQADFQISDYRLIRRIQRFDVILGYVGVEGDLVALITGAVVDYKNAGGANDSMEWLIYRTVIRSNGLQHHRRIADRHEPGALEHMHQGQRALGLAGGNRAVGFFGRSGSNEGNVLSDLEHLLHFQCRNAPEAFGPLVKGVQAISEVTENAVDVRPLAIQGRQD